jgi:hypothetical protein
MRITVDFENGMEVKLKPENIQLIDNNGQGTVLTFKTEHTLVPIMFFKTLLATPAELKAREDAAKAAEAAKAADAKAAELAKAVRGEITMTEQLKDFQRSLTALEAAKAAPTADQPDGR